MMASYGTYQIPITQVNGLLLSANIVGLELIFRLLAVRHALPAGMDFPDGQGGHGLLEAFSG